MRPKLPQITQEEVIEARRRYAAGETMTSIASNLGGIARSRESLHPWLSGKWKYTQPKLKKIPDSRLEIIKKQAEEREQERVPDHVVEAARRRLARAPRDITAALMGDPLPGESALDRRRGCL